MDSRTAIFVCLSLIAIQLIISVHCNEVVVKTNGKKGKGGSIIVMGKKCTPTLIKDGGKKGKDIIIVGNNHNCHKKYEHKYIPIPIYHQYVHHQPVIEHQHYDHGYGGHSSGYGGDHGGYHGPSDYGHGGGYDMGHESYGHEEHGY